MVRPKNYSAPAHHPETVYSRYTGDIDGFISHSQRLADPNVIIVHIISPADIEIRGDFAFAESVGHITSRFLVDGHNYDMISYCKFLSRLENIDRKWKMLSLEVIYIKDAVTPVGDSPALDFSSLQGWTRPSYQFIAWHVRTRGLPVREDLPGEDDQESVRRVYKENHAWIQSK